MANANSTSITLLEAEDALNHAYSMLAFLQDVLTLTNDGNLPENINSTGLYYIFEDIKERIIDSNVVFNNYVNNNIPTDSKETKPRAKTFLHRN
jgi:hypothetical protein